MTITPAVTATGGTMNKSDADTFIIATMVISILLLAAWFLL